MDFMKELKAIVGDDGMDQLGFDKDGNKKEWALEGRLLDESASVNERTRGADTVFSDTYTRAEAQRYVAAFQRDISPNMEPTRELVERYIRTRGHTSLALVEEVCARLGIQKDLSEANPFHSPSSGKFTSPEGVVSAGGGSKSFQFSTSNYPDRSRGGRVGVDRKTGKRRALIKWVKAKQPCGRRARQQGIDVRCWDGKRLESIGIKVGKNQVTDDLALLKSMV
jgi:hypothetical protein